MSDYTDIQPELDDFENAVYGEEVRSGMISAIKKIHDIAESAASAPDASSASAGQAPIADGEGGWQWGNIDAGGQPTAVNTASEMEDTEKLYLYLGSESGYQYGYVYAYTNGAWTSTGLYGKGEDGANGADGYSPTATVTQTATGVSISVTDKNGTTSATVENGTATQEQVDSWLDEHPEATTTVQDGSITSAKLATSAFDNTLSTIGKIADAKVVGDSIGELKENLDYNDIPQNIEKLALVSSQISNAATHGVTITKVSDTSIIIDGTADAAFNLHLDFGIVDLSEIMYYFFKRSDGLTGQSGVWVQMGYLNDSGAVTQLTTIENFNTAVLFTFPTEAKKSRNYLHIGAGTTFNNVRFDILAFVEKPLIQTIDDLNSVLYGTDETFMVEKIGYYNIPYLLIDGLTYTYTNNTSSGTNLLLLKSDGTTTVLSGVVNEGKSFQFTVDGDDYIAIRFYANATGSVSIVGGYSLINARDEISEMSVINGIEFHNGYINASGGISSQSTTNLEVYTDKIQCDTGFSFSLTLTYASADAMWVAYALYDERGTFIERPTLDAGVSRLSHTYIVTITNTNARYIAFTFRTHGDCVSVIKSLQHISILDFKIGDIDDRLSTLENEVQLSANTVRSVNHRGYNTVAPENTLPAYKLSRKMGFDAAETDVAFTSDGVAVLLHDGTINRTARNADGTEIASSINIGTITYEQALQYDFGIWKGTEYAGTKIPTFTQFIQLCKRIGLSAYVELKPTGTTEARVRGLIDTVKNCGMIEYVTWISFYPALLTYVKNYDSTARIGFITESVTAETIQTAESLKTMENEVFIDSDVYNADAVAVCANANLPLEVWTINNQTIMENLDPYITGATSDSLIFGRVLYNKYVQ